MKDISDMRNLMADEIEIAFDLRFVPQIRDTGRKIHSIRRDEENRLMHGVNIKQMQFTLDTLRNMERIQAESGDIEGFLATRRKADMLYYKIESLSRKKFYDSEFSAGSIHFNSASDE